MNKPRTARQTGDVIFRAVASGWQKWRQEGEGSLQLASEAPALSALKPEAGGVIAVPVRRAFSLAVWVPSGDPALFGDLVYTQLELHGLAGRDRDSTAFIWRSIATRDGETLIHAIVLPPHLDSKYWHGDVTSYAVSPACLPLAPDTVTVWEEEGGWVASVTRGQELLHFQPLTSQVPGDAMALEIWLLLAPLEAGKMLDGSPSVHVLYQGLEPPDLGDWRSASDLAVSASPLPPPVVPAQNLQCMPLPVREVRKSKEASSRRQKIALAAAAAYFLVVLALAGSTFFLQWRAESLRKLVARDAGAVAAIRATTARWENMQAALDPATYPLEILYQAARLLPKDGVRLTLFSMNLDRVVIGGEASTLPAAQKFQQDVATSPELAGYDWTKENPRPLPSGSAKFQIEGARRGSSATEEDQDEGPDA